LDAGSSWFVLPVVVLSVVVHECAHGLVALWNGDSTARDGGRLTLHPVPHLDGLGTLVVPAVLLLAGAPVRFAWGKPAPVDHAALRDLRNGPVWVALAGPAANGLLAVALAAAGAAAPEDGLGPAWREIARGGVLWNCGLAWLNLMPIPPLDGARVLERFLPLRHIVALHHARVPALVLLSLIALVPSPARALLAGPPEAAARALLAAFGVPAEG
jgi:Zn-dependent protease